MSAMDVASGFSISGLLDAGSQTASRFPVREIPLSDIQEHPSNVAYSMDEEGIARLAESIRRDGLTDLPLVRRLRGGGFQMISGHRRMAAFRLLSQQGPSYSKIPCRIVSDVSDEQAVVLLHTANFFTRSLTVTERVCRHQGPRHPSRADARSGPVPCRHAHGGRQGAHRRGDDGPQGERKDHQARGGACGQGRGPHSRMARCGGLRRTLGQGRRRIGRVQRGDAEIGVREVVGVAEIEGGDNRADRLDDGLETRRRQAARKRREGAQPLRREPSAEPLCGGFRGYIPHRRAGPPSRRCGARVHRSPWGSAESVRFES